MGLGWFETKRLLLLGYLFLWPPSLMLLLHRSGQAEILGWWSRRAFVLVVADLAVLLAATVLLWQAWSRKGRLVRRIEAALLVVRRKRILLWMAAWTPPLCFLATILYPAWLSIPLSLALLCSLAAAFLLVCVWELILLVPGRDDAFYKHYEFQHRGIGAEYLDHIAQDHPGAGRFVFSKLRVGTKDPVVHAKVMLVDDELALVGSTNVALRSMALCSEIHMAIIDEKNEFARNLRLDLWGEHMGLDDYERILDPDKAVDAYRQTAEEEKGHLRLLPTKRLDLRISYGRVWDDVIDPYRGPDPDK